MLLHNSQTVELIGLVAPIPHNNQHLPDVLCLEWETGITSLGSSVGTLLHWCVNERPTTLQNGNGNTWHPRCAVLSPCLHLGAQMESFHFIHSQLLTCSTVSESASHRHFFRVLQTYVSPTAVSHCTVDANFRQVDHKIRSCLRLVLTISVGKMSF